MSGQGQTICCCGATTWSKVIAWIHIVANALFLILSIIAIAGIAALADSSNVEVNKGLVYTGLAISIVLYLFGLIMGVILLKGTNQRRVTYLKAWLIYGIVSMVVTILSLILSVVGGTTAASLASGILGTAFNLAVTGFTVWVVWVLKKEIEMGVHGPTVY